MSSAASPVGATDDGHWPKGAVAPMAQEACDALIEACNRDEGVTTPVFVFLVGGAGNGKSKLAADVIKNVRGSTKEAPQAFARRLYTFDLRDGRRLAVVNDATIPPRVLSPKPALVSDIATSLEEGRNLLACINRGVLIGEASAPIELLDQPSELIAHSLLKWVLDSAMGTPPSVEGWTVVPSSSRDGTFGHYRHAVISDQGSARAILHVVYMDQASLLESWPQPARKMDAAELGRPLEVKPLSVTPLLKREHGSRSMAAFAPALSSGARAFLNSIGEVSREGDIDPVLANAAALSHIEFADSWCSMMRGAEVISGVRFTYRELWALFSHSLIGGPPESDLRKLTKLVSDACVDAKEGADLQTRLGALMALAQLRTHMVLFGGTKIRPENGSAFPYPWPHVSNDALHAVSLADPLRDYGPAGGQAYSELVDTISGIEEGRLPGALLASKDLQVARSWSAFDALLESTVAELANRGIDRPELKRRNFILGWYGQYLFRLVALAKGWPAHVSIVDRWQQSWLEASTNGRLPAELEQAVLRVLLPSTAGRTQVRFPLLRPRIEDVPEGEEHVSVEVDRSSFVLSANTRGDQIVIRIRRESLTAAETVLDFHMVREAEAREKGHGFTDSMLLVEPRLERMRAGVLAFELQRSIDGAQPRFVFRRGGSDFYVG